jgi:ATPase involved in DNA repair/ATPase family associated with various cellular activities (AAA)
MAMSQEAIVEAAPTGEGAENAAAGGDIEGGNYEVIRRRLIEHGRALLERTEALNDARKETFGGTELSVSGNPRIRTENNCVPRDIVQVGGLLLFGYEVFIGLKSETKESDIFALHGFNRTDDGGFDCPSAGLEAAGGFLQDPQFLKELQNLYKFTRDARLLRLQKTDRHLFAVFQVGSSPSDVRVFRWRLEKGSDLVYVDDRGERTPDYAPPPSHAFEWMAPDLEWQVDGRHIRILDEIFVSNLDGKLTLRVEDNTAAGRVILRESLDDHNQALTDLGLEYARIGPLILLKILPYRESKHRYIIFNTKTAAALRVDAVGVACQELPEDHGVIFPGGYYLASGESKVFEHETTDLDFEQQIKSPNGEDVLYVFHRQHDGHYVLFPYNLIRKEVQTPIHCHGYSLFDDGLMVVFRALNEEPTRVHPMQVWDTPFTSAEHAAKAPVGGSYLANVGNAELVRGISDAFSICRLIDAAEPTRHTYEDLASFSAKAQSAYFWLSHEEVGDLKQVIDEIHATSLLVVEEFEKVVEFRQQAAAAAVDAEERFLTLTRDLQTAHFKKVDPFLEALTSLRSLRGHIITLREMRYIDRERLDALEDQTKEGFDDVSKDCVTFLLKEEALAPLMTDLEGTLSQLEAVTKVAEVVPLKNKIDATAEGLDLLSEVVANLQIEDATKRTSILEGISEVFAHLNRVRATVEGRRKDLLGQEGRAEFAAQFALLGQSVSSALAVCDTPERCDDQLSRLMVQLEELEGRFSEFDEFLADLADKREEVYDAFGAKKQQLLDERQRRVMNISNAAERILEGVARRGRATKSADELNAYFASDGMVMKVRQLCEQLVGLGDNVKADNYLARLKSAQQDALRGLRDELELFEGGSDLIKLGKHRFSVNRQRLELSMVPRQDGMALHLSGTDFYEAIEDEAFAATEHLWSRNLVSENSDVYRGEFLVASILEEAEAASDAEGLSIGKLHEHLREGTLLEVTRGLSQSRYDEGYDRGIHDADAALILEKLVSLREAAGLLRFAPTPRALATLYWDWHPDEAAKKRWHLQAASLGRLRSSMGPTASLKALAMTFVRGIGDFVTEQGLDAVGCFSSADVQTAAHYLVEELVDAAPTFAVSSEAAGLRDALLRHVDLHGDRRAFDDDMRALSDRLQDKLNLALAWVDAFVDGDAERRSLRHLRVECAALLCDRGLSRASTSALTDVEVSGLLGQHPRIESGTMKLRIDEFLERLGHFRAHEVPAFRAYRELRHAILERERLRLRLEEYVPRVMSAFVRNKLINDVYLPLIGDNLAKQIGAAGAQKRTDLMGLLLLISPPGYGKTTLMEYVANRLGLVFVKVNGPSLGHQVVSLDPSEAPNATARQEVEKINLAFEMGNNVMLYLDDIQHTHPELLQKFISLCDAQRRIEGVYAGRTRTYDMRGKKFCVVMAGNPYTESGDKFQIPDMLANRADTYNLGDILEGKDDAFSLSYVENAITSNATLAPLATREQSDTYKLIRMARGEDVPTSQLSHGYSAVELGEITSVLRHLFRAQRTVLMVNMQYIASASQDDRFRTEPPFKLQGSYRNMNRLAEKIASVMTEDEVEQLLTDHYVGESQTLTTGAEQNLLKLAAMRGTLTEEQAARWEDLKSEFTRHTRMGGSADDPVARVTGTLNGLSEDLDGIRKALTVGSEEGAQAQIAALDAIRDALLEVVALRDEPEPAEEVDVEVDVDFADLEDNPRVGRAERLAGKEVWMKPYLLRIEAALEALGHPQVQIRASDELRQTIEQQRQLIEHTLVPLVRKVTGG